MRCLRPREAALGGECCGAHDQGTVGPRLRHPSRPRLRRGRLLPAGGQARPGRTEGGFHGDLEGLRGLPPEGERLAALCPVADCTFWFAGRGDWGQTSSGRRRMRRRLRAGRDAAHRRALRCCHRAVVGVEVEAIATKDDGRGGRRGWRPRRRLWRRAVAGLRRGLPRAAIGAWWQQCWREQQQQRWRRWAGRQILGGRL
mmetsp:Transcript_95820/g.310483  ORF Transcript_95820/g.310483 Transcript_95820/m.310483 type:complete len:200 (+) Transcript_95820:575-1174(+)